MLSELGFRGRLAHTADVDHMAVFGWACLTRVRLRKEMYLLSVMLLIIEIAMQAEAGISCLPNIVLYFSVFVLFMNFTSYNTGSERTV